MGTVSEPEPALSAAAGGPVARFMAGPGPVVLLAVYLLALLGWAQFGANGFYEHDGYFHARYAQLLPRRGLARDFPWTQASTWKDRFCDKEFLYHVLMAPFAWDAADPARGVRWFSLGLGLAVCFALYRLLRAQGTPWPWLFTAALTFSSGVFLVRLEMTRSHVLSILLAVVGVHFLLEKRWKALAVLGFVYAWSYTFPLVLVMIAAPFVLGRWLAGGGLDWRSPLAAAAGVLAGLVLHPYTPLTLETFLTYLDVTRFGVAAAGQAPVGMAVELNPMDTREFLSSYLLVHVALGGLALAACAVPRKLRPESVAALAAALFWYGMTMVYQRMGEYAVPLAVVAAALAARDLLAGVEWRRDLFVPRPGLAVTLVILAGLAVGGGLCTALTTQAQVLRLAAPPQFRGAAAWMAEHLEPGETVVNLSWDDFPDLYYDGYRQHYLCGLDPTYMLRWDREKAIALEEMRAAAKPLDRAWLARTFGARYLVLRKAVVPCYAELQSGAGRPAYEDETAAIYALKGP